MFKHFVAISSLYSKGIRIALHFSGEQLDSSEIQKFLNSLHKKHGDIQLGIHRLTTESPYWESVVEADGYFKDLIVVKRSEQFIDLIGIEQRLTAVHIAKYVLTLAPISHLKLQKLVYLIYERFLKTTGEKLFDDDIFAWKHGPVIKSVYDVFKVHGSSPIAYEEDDSAKIYSDENLSFTPSFVKVISTEHGFTALNTIHEVLKDYQHLGAWDLVDLTHQEGSPWSKVYKPNINKIITDDVILGYS
ncbi:hypothetical protein CSV80_00945 [Sporosarcina sp. P12(2017)]|uniref:Panacea domain-containing protein n=1 Tax=unclassified Sporosarcina TaxID=2647733 RepID=UPI000C16E5BD|nr:MULTISPECIES: type II toxin-antitoxin system antitoxin SocA domain-containing protein [unclassified Sporosarcina]PIC59123.1 hypothetical protein CSV81_00945 [Sporosarcina sp. P10]PIC62444.1 hypothetical protein CSV80_00945 [Sporosarcina sp. P12(2017)]